MSNSATPTARERWRLFGAVALLALCVRAVHLLSLRKLEFFQVLGLDAEFYDRWAHELIAGTAGSREPYFQGPLYPMFLSLVYRLPGPDVLSAQLAQLGLGALSAGMAALLAREFFERRVAILCGVLASCYGFAIFLETHLVAAPLISCGVVTALWLLARADGTGGHKLLAGVLLGLSAVGSGLVLVAVALCAPIYLLQRRRAAVRTLSLVAVGLLLPILPVSWHNVRVGREFVLLSTNGGINYFIGNHAGASGAYEAVEGVEFFQAGMPHDGGSAVEASRRAGRSMTPGMASNFWLQEGLRWQGAEPGAALQLIGRKLLYLSSDYEIPQIENFDWAQRESNLLRLSPFRAGILVPLGLIGLYLAARAVPRTRVLAWALFAYALAVAAFFVTARFRVVMLPALCAFSAYAVLDIARALRTQALRRGLGSLVALALLCLLAFRTAPSGVRESSQQLLAYSRGVTLMQRSDFAAAAREFQLAAQQNPAHVASWANLGFCQEQLGQTDAAIASYSASLRLEPGNGRVLQPLSTLLLRSGQFELAEQCLQELTRVDPSNWLAWASLGDLAMQRGDDEGMRRNWQRVRDGSPDGELRALAEERLGPP